MFNRRFLFITLFFIVTLLSSCSQKEENIEALIVPKPQKINQYDGIFELTNTTKIVVVDQKLFPLGNLLNDHVKTHLGFNLKIAKDEPLDKNISFVIDSTLTSEAYALEVSEGVTIKASNYNGVALGLSSLVQLMTFKNNRIDLPQVSISDYPDYEYRAVSIDLARFFHPIETIKETIDMLWLYKIRFLALHLSDNRRVTFPFDEFPDLKTVNENGSREYYTLEELEELVEYAKQRGIALIPEIDLPGHSTQFWTKYPETFGSIDPKTVKPRTLNVINIANEKTYKASEKIIKRLAEVFYTSPYIHLGADEVNLKALKDLPEYKTFCKKNGLDLALNGDANELFCYFINRMNEAIKKNGRQTLVWEGFHNMGAGKETIARDIKVIVWDATFNTPENLISNGYEVINSSWIPWYMVGAMNFAPTPQKGYDWDVTEWSHWDNRYQDHTVAPNSLIKGGQLSFWEQNYYQVIPILRTRLPVLSERLWNSKSTSSYEAFEKRKVSKDSLYDQLFRPVVMEEGDLLSKGDLTFKERATIRLNTHLSGKIKYVYSENWSIPNMDNAYGYSQPISINESGILTVQLFDENDNEMGYPIQRYYQKINSAYKYKVFGGAPNKGWDSLPNFSELHMLREGVTGKMTASRLDKINGELFKKVKEEGHIETRFSGLYNPYAVELKGTLNSEENIYTLKLLTDDGLAELFIDDVLVAKGQQLRDVPEEFTFNLTKGRHSFKINYYYRQIQNQLNIMYKTPKMETFEPFEELVEPYKP